MDLSAQLISSKGLIHLLDGIKLMAQWPGPGWPAWALGN